MCCSLLEVSGLSLCILNDFEVLPVESWPLRQAFLFTCTDDVLELEGGDTGEGGAKKCLVRNDKRIIYLLFTWYYVILEKDFK